MEKQTKNIFRKILFVTIALLLLYYFPTTIYNRYFNPRLLPVTVHAVEDEKKIGLPDGSTVYLASGATFIYTKEFPADRRKTELRGTASVEINEDDRPFKMKLKRNLIIGNQGELLIVQKENASYELKIKKGDFSIEEYNTEGDIENVFMVHSGDKIIIGAYVKVQ